MTAWTLAYDRFDPKLEPLHEALCTLGNGYIATRGAAHETPADGVHYPGTYLAGGFNRLKTQINAHVVENEDLVNLPNWLLLTFRPEGGDWFKLASVDISTYRQELDIRRGILSRTVAYTDRQGRRTRVDSRRLVHMRDPHLLAQEVTVTPENWSGRLEICSALDGRVTNDGVARYRDLNNRHLVPLETRVSDDGVISLKVQTSQSELRIAEAARTRVFRDGEALTVGRRAVEQPGYVAHEFSVDVAEGHPVTIEKICALYTSRDHAIAECGLEASAAARRAGGFDELLRTHAQTWDHYWRWFDIEIDLDAPEAAQRTHLILCLHIFHLLQTTSLNTTDLDVGVPARGLHGEAYRGHIFWDELFVFPLLNLRMPEITRGLLKYRYRRLGEARAAAREAGFRGAMFPWQSGSNGREESQKLHLNPKSGRWIPDRTHLQRHVSAAVAYNVWEYYQATGDLEFMAFFGAEMLLEIARFWSSIATYNAALDRYEILGVMGPDEYHDAYPGTEKAGLSNNAYTNAMAVWVLHRALETLTLLPENRRAELVEKLDLHDDELARWQEIGEKMRIVFHGDGIISQFEGYERLEEFDWEGYRQKYGDIQRLDRILEAEGDTANRYKLSKQADVLMLFYLFSSDQLRAIFERLGYPFEYDTIPRNIDYYLRRTSHGSTLSRVAHSWVLARSDRPGSWELFTQALESDVSDIQGGTTPEGIHLGAMAGTVDLVQGCYTGIEMHGDVLWLNPHLPEPVVCLHLRLRYRGHSLDIEFTRDRILVKALVTAAGAIRIGFGDDVFPVEPGASLELPARAPAVIRK